MVKGLTRCLELEKKGFVIVFGWAFLMLVSPSTVLVAKDKTASAALVPGIDAVVGFYGTPSPRLADPAQAKAPIQAHFGELDNIAGFSDVATAKSLEEKLKLSGVPSEVHIYPGSGHAFMNPSPEGIERRKAMGLDESK